MLEISRALETSLSLPTSPYISLHLTTSHYISLHLPTSPYISLGAPGAQECSLRQLGHLISMLEPGDTWTSIGVGKPG